MKVGIYSRVSTDEQKLKGVSLDDQKSRGVEFCIKNGYDYESFQDGGYSGTLPIEDRPELNRLFEKIYLEELHGIFIVDWDRLTRDETVGFVIKKIFKDNNIRVFDTNGEINLNDESQDLLVGIKILLSSFEIKRLKVRIKRNLERGVIEGRVGGGNLINYGYTKGENKKLIIDPIESETVKLIYKLSLEGKGTKVISNFLNENNIPTKRMNVKNSKMMVKGKEKKTFIWRDSVVYNILTNPIYKGERLFKGKTYPSPQIIETNEFDAVQSELVKRKNFKDTTNKYFYLLKGLVHCLECESRFYGRKRSDLSDNQYICSSQRYKDTYCGTRGINIDKLDDYVWKSIVSLPSEIDNLISNEVNPLHKKQLESLKKLENNLKLLYEKKDKILLLYTEKDKGFELIKSNLDKISKKVEEHNHRIRLLQKEISYTSNKDEIVKFVKEQLNLKKSQSNDPLVRQNIIRSLTRHIGIKWNNKQKIHFIWIEFKIDKQTQYLIGKKIKLNYKSLGWRLQNDKTETEFLFRKISPDISNYPKIDMTKDLFGIRLNDKDYKEEKVFK
jgi:site-specific DNA recombinase